VRVGQTLLVIMTKIMILAMGGLAVFLAASAAGSGQTAPATTPAYVDENQPDPAPLKLRDVDGSVRGLGGDGMSRASVSLFTEAGHALIGTVVSDKDGKFRFGKVDKGLYRIVARVEGLCTANIPILVESSLLAHRKVVITMRPKDIDTCSYGMAK
jgi:hypothetical protein